MSTPRPTRRATAGSGRRTPGSQQPGGPRAGRGRGESARGTARVPSAARPARQRRTSASIASALPRRGGRLTGRSAILAVVVCLLVLTLAYPTQKYLSQRSQIAQLEQAQATQQQRISGLAKQKAQWNDPNYVKAQARQRLQYVEPGDSTFVVVGGDRSTAASGGPAGTAAGAGPWYGKLAGSLAGADRPAGR
ncbi:septum formation initiator family protein [Fodinicola feengrottensis]|uniref:Septum formation initiator family protein n=1 Tax=Fodinicola feengrottensis TaxID=435914 RepID=A0ABP4TI16_9ACTN|nr:septum formation initiator family protein [Fodinicola feengrottensis]